MVTQWVKVRIDELIEEKIGLGTKVEQDDFMTAVK